MIRALLIEDNPGDARLIKEMISEAAGTEYYLEHADRLSAALERLARGDINVILMDLSLPDSQGLQTFARVHAHAGQLPIIVLTGLNNEAAAVETVGMGAQDYLVKGQISGHLLVRAMRYAIERKRTQEALRASETKYRTLVESLSEGVYQSDLEGNFITLNRAGAKIFGYDSPEEIVGKIRTVDLFADICDRALIIEDIRRTGSSLREAQAKRRDGSLIWMLVSNNARRDGEGRIVGYEGVFSDITERRQAEESLHTQNQELTILTRVSQSLSRSVKLQDVLQTALKGTLDVLEMRCGGIYLTAGDVRELELVMHEGISEGDRCAPSKISINSEVFGKAVSTGEVRVIHWPENGCWAGGLKPPGVETKPMTCVSVPLRSKGRVLGLLNLVADDHRVLSSREMSLLETIGNQIGIAIENAQLFERMTLLSLTDELTGLYNRRHFYEAIEAEISRSQRYGFSFSLAMLDIDRFKQYNDQFGHINGDSALRSFAQTLRSTLRKSDLAFRYGGDEFIVILPQTDADNARRIIMRTRMKWLAVPKLQLPALENSLGFSAGIAQFPHDASSADGLVFLADTALLHSKRQGGYSSALVSEIEDLAARSLTPSTLAQLHALAATADARHHSASGHSRRVAAITEAIGSAVGLGTREMADLRAASLLHDIGELVIPDSAIAKNGGLTEEARMKKHCVEGAQIVGRVPDLAALVPVIRHHHEWYDGGGYPDGLRGGEIPLNARILAVADAYESITTQRPPRESMSHEAAIEELQRHSGTRFDPNLVEVSSRVLKGL